MKMVILDVVQMMSPKLEAKIMKDVDVLIPSINVVQIISLLLEAQLTKTVNVIPTNMDVALMVSGLLEDQDRYTHNAQNYQIPKLISEQDGITAHD